VSALLYAGQAFLLHELATRAVTKANRSTTATFFIQNSNFLQYKNKLFTIKTIFMPNNIVNQDFPKNSIAITNKYNKRLIIVYEEVYFDQLREIIDSM
jgi:hypothetical protein